MVWCLLFKSSVWPLGVVKFNPVFDDPFGLKSVLQFMQVDSLWFQGPPQALNKDVVEVTTFAVHRDFDIGILNRPGFTGECFVQMSGNFIKVVHVYIEGLLCFIWCDISDRTVQTFGVVPIEPFQGFPFNLAHGFPRAKEVDDFGFE